jgi:F-type H+-transporting ATPase subunit delta
MTGRTSAARYAKALFDVVLNEKLDPEQAAADVTAFAGLVRGNPALERALTSPAVPKQRKGAVVEQLLAQAGTVQKPVARLLLLLADRDRLALLPDLADAVQRRLMDIQQVVRAEVVTAVPLPPDRARALQAGLARATGRQVRLDARVDPEIVGGAVTRIGSTVYDGSVTRQLERIRASLVTADNS